MDKNYELSNVFIPTILTGGDQVSPNVFNPLGIFGFMHRHLCGNLVVRRHDGSRMQSGDSFRLFALQLHSEFGHQDPK